MDLTRQALNIDEFRALARRRLPKGLFDFIDRGNEDDVALRNNRGAFSRYKLRPRVLVDVAHRDLSVDLFGRRYAMPIGIAPTGAAGYVWHQGEIALARAASRAGVPLTLSSAAAAPMEAVVSNGGDGPKWFQLYMSGDRELSLQTIDRAEAAGYDALVVTVDAIITPNREFSARNGFTIPFRVSPGNVWDVLTHPRWLAGVMGQYALRRDLDNLPNYPIPDRQNPARGGVAMKDQTIDWGVLAAIRKKWPRTLIVKGVVDPRDAQLCLDCGCDGVVVSNHGGVYLDASLAPIDALPPIVDQVGGKIAVFVDGGFRRGTDIVTALALGADMVFVGRATLFALAVGGEAGAARAIDLLRAEIDRTLAVLGCNSVSDLTRDHVVVMTR